MSEHLKQLIAGIPDFPEPGILFRDITPILQDPVAFQEALELLAEPFLHDDVDAIVGVESRGFLFGAPLALQKGWPLVLARKAGKLPRETVSASYDLEYGSATLQIHRDAIRPGQRILVVDDLLATGGTARAIAGMIESLGARVVGLAFLIELSGLNGRQNLDGWRVHAPLVY